MGGSLLALSRSCSAAESAPPQWLLPLSGCGETASWSRGLNFLAASVASPIKALPVVFKARIFLLAPYAGQTPGLLLASAHASRTRTMADLAHGSDVGGRLRRSSLHLSVRLSLPCSGSSLRWADLVPPFCPALMLLSPVTLLSVGQGTALVPVLMLYPDDACLGCSQRLSSTCSQG